MFNCLELVTRSCWNWKTKIKSNMDISLWKRIDKIKWQKSNRNRTLSRRK